VQVPKCRAALLAVLAACGDGGLQWEGTFGAPVSADIALSTPVIDAVVDDTLTGRFLVDTGAPYTILDTDSFPIEDGAHDIALDAFGVSFFDYDVVAYDALPFPMGSTPLAGIIGGDLLRNFAFALDYQGARAWLFDEWDGAPPADVDLAGAAAMDIELRGGGNYIVPGTCDGGCGLIDIPATRIVVSAMFEGEPVLALVDTGATAVVLSDTLVDALGDAGRPRLDGVTVGTATGPRTAYFTRIGSLELGGSVSLGSVPSLVVPGWDLFDAISSEVDADVQAIIGGSALRHFVTTIDYPSRELVLAEYADPSHIDPREFVRPGFELVRSGERWVVSDVYDSSDAEAQGVRSGETVAELGGTPIGALEEAEVLQLLDGYAVGGLVPVGLQRVAGLETVDVMMEDLLPEYEGP
jgi:hypothetical protein